MWGNNIQSTIDLIDDSILEEAENTIGFGNIIKASYDSDVKKYRALIQDSKNWLDKYREKLIKQTGIATLRIKYTSAAGYFIEIAKSQTSKIATDFVHKQTLVNASRYVTNELLAFEKDRVSAEEKMAQREYEIFGEIRGKILGNTKEIRETSQKIANLDVESGLAKLAYTHNYTKPTIHESYDLKIIGGRHPVIETIGPDFISNDLHLDHHIFNHIITGPNMGGKSTFLRQNTLIILLAHIGSFVPAISAKIPLTDKLFSRIGASDNLYLGQSTFMVEMQEIAYILNNATEKSFVIIDEVGRGTSTYDGLSLAWAILKENHDCIGAKTLFSTHYHELCEESKILPGVKNFSVSVGDEGEDIVFLRKIVPGAMYKSYGIEVAKLAGIGKGVLQESRRMLQKMQQQSQKQLSLTLPEVQEKKTEVSQVLQELEQLDINSLTPVEALLKLQELKDNV